MKNDTKKLTLLALLTAIALILSYLESLLPPLSAFFPGVKLGLANIAILFTLYRYGVKEAAAVSFVRLFLSTLLFGSVVSLFYGAAGAVLSLASMGLLRRLSVFSAVGVSVVGGVMHNMGQIGVAVLLTETAAVGYYLPILLLSGILSGVAVGIAAALCIRYFEKHTKK